MGEAFGTMDDHQNRRQKLGSAVHFFCAQRGSWGTLGAILSGGRRKLQERTFFYCHSRSLATASFIMGFSM